MPWIEGTLVVDNDGTHFLRSRIGTSRHSRRYPRIADDLLVQRGERRALSRMAAAGAAGFEAVPLDRLHQGNTRIKPIPPSRDLGENAPSKAPTIIPSVRKESLAMVALTSRIGWKTSARAFRFLRLMSVSSCSVRSPALLRTRWVSTDCRPRSSRTRMASTMPEAPGNTDDDARAGWPVTLRPRPARASPRRSPPAAPSRVWLPASAARSHRGRASPTCRRATTGQGGCRARPAP